MSSENNYHYYTKIDLLILNWEMVIPEIEFKKITII